MPSPLGKGPSIHRSARSLNKMLSSHIALAKAGKLPEPSKANLGYTTMSVARKAKRAFLGSQHPYQSKIHTIAKQPDKTEHSVRGPRVKDSGVLEGKNIMNFEAWWKFPKSKKGQGWKKGNKFYNGHLEIIDNINGVDPRGSETFKNDS